jgi:hypothetical protein
MILLHTIELLIGAITFFISYLGVITFSNYFRTWVADKMGDDTAVRLGYLTFNPFFHFDPIGTLFLFFFYFGWGRMAPICSANIVRPYRNFKLIAAYFSNTAANLFLSVVGILMLLAIFDIRIIAVMRYMLLTYNISHMSIANMYPHISSTLVSLGFVIFSFVYINVALGVLEFIINLSSYLLVLISDRDDTYSNSFFVNFGLPIIFILFFSDILRRFSVDIITYVGLSIASICGIA